MNRLQHGGKYARILGWIAVLASTVLIANTAPTLAADSRGASDATATAFRPDDVVHGADSPWPIGEGDFSPAVAAIQRRLEITADCDFGGQTRAAVEQWQATEGIPVTGSIDEAAWNLLDIPLEWGNDADGSGSVEPSEVTLACGESESTNQNSAAPTGATIAAGAYHSCAIVADLSILCWGEGAGAEGFPTDIEFTAISAGEAHTCAISTAASIECWGADSFGQSSPPDGEFEAISVSALHSCALRSDHTIACWGDGDLGQTSPPEGEFIAVAAGGDHSCGIRQDRTITCWGGTGIYEDTTAIPAGVFSSVAAKSHHLCAIDTGGNVVCWGNNFDDQASPPGGQFTQVTVGWMHSCGLRPDRTVECWGLSSVVDSTPAGEFTEINAGGVHTCGVLVDGAIVCWGENEDGQASPPAEISTAAEATPETPTEQESDPGEEAADGFIMPDVVGMNLQDAQDLIQQVSGNPFFVTLSVDATGDGRMQILDGNWYVCAQNVAAGTTVNDDTEIIFAAVKNDEVCPF